MPVSPSSHERGVRCVGTDGLSVGTAHDGVPAHLAGLSRAMVFREALTNLAALPLRGAYFIMLPLHIEEGSGGPGRAVAILPPPNDRVMTRSNPGRRRVVPANRGRLTEPALRRCGHRPC